MVPPLDDNVFVKELVTCNHVHECCRQHQHVLLSCAAVLHMQREQIGHLKYCF